MKLLWTALAFFSAGALACPADDVKDAQINAQDSKAVAAAKAPARSTAPAKAVASKKAQTTKVAAETTRKSSL